MGEISEFGRLAAALNEAEQTAGNRIGGPTKADVEAIRLLRARVAGTRPETTDDWRWVARRLARALVNGWSNDDAAPLVRLAGDPLTVGCGG